MYNFLFPFLFSSSSSVISLSLLVFLLLSASSFAVAAKASPSSSSSSLSVFFLQSPLQPNQLATMPPARRDKNANTNASTPELTVMIQVPSTMTPEQTDLIFELTRRKLEAEIAAAEVEARLRRELMVKEPEARVAASVAAASAANTAAALARRPMADKEDDITGEVPTEVIFNLFAEALHWIIASFRRWLLCHYLDDFVAIFRLDNSPERLVAEANTYIWLTDLLGLLRNDSKDCQGTVVTIFGIKVDRSPFTARLPRDKLEKVILASSKVLSQKVVSYIDIQSLVGFRSFCSQAVRLGREFMRRLWDFINHYPHDATTSTLRKIPVWVKEDL